MATPYTVLDRRRVRYETYAETGTVAADLTGRTLTLLVGDLAAITCSITSTSPTESAFTTGALPSGLSDAVAGAHDYALVIDLGHVSEERVAMMGDWIVVDRPDGTP